MSLSSSLTPKSYQSLLMDVAHIYESFQSNANSDWNKIFLVSYWKIGQRMVEVEQGNQEKASYGDRILIQLSKDLNQRFGKCVSDRNLRYMRHFFQFYKLGKISLGLSWSHRELLLKVQAVLRKRDSVATAETDSEFSEDGDKGILLLKRSILGLFYLPSHSKFFF